MSAIFSNAFPDWTIVRSDQSLAAVATVGRRIEIWTDKGGTLTLARSDDHDSYRLSFDHQVAVDLILSEKRLVETELAADVPKSTRDHFLADQVLPRMVAHYGHLVLHAGAVVLARGTKAGAVAILGDSGAGKSTLVASFKQAGDQLLGDDAMIVDFDERRPSIRPVYRSLRLFPDSIDRFFPSAATLDVAHYTSKQRIRLDLPSQVVPASPPLDALFVLGAPSDDGAIKAERLSMANACMALIENSFMLDPTDLERAQTRMRKASRLVGDVPAFALSFPRDYDVLPDVRSAILSAVEQLHFVRE